MKDVFSTAVELQQQMIRAQQAQLGAAQRMLGAGQQAVGTHKAVLDAAEANRRAWNAWAGVWGWK